MKKINIAIIIAILVAIGVFSVKKARNNSDMGTTTPNQIEENKVAQPTYPLVNESATTTYTKMTLSYPKSSPSSYGEIYDFVRGVKGDFVKDYASLSDEESEKNFMRVDSPYELYMTTRIETSSKTVTFIIETYQYTGGAHGGTSVTTFTYDSSKKLIPLDNVLKGNYLKKLSDISRSYFYTSLGENSQKVMIDSGTEATSDNFSSWYLTDNTIVFIFGQYQVGPYVIGIQEFPINKSDISDFLK